MTEKYPNGEVVDGIYYGTDDEGNKFFTAEGSEAHLNAQKKEADPNASQTETVSEDDKTPDTAAKPGRKKADSDPNSE